jgi:integrase
MATQPDARPRHFPFTRPSVDAARCEPGKSQTIYWDTKQPGLGLRVTANDARAFIFESKLGRQTVRLTIGPASMQIRAPKDKRGQPTAPGADTRAVELAALVARGVDPRAVIRQNIETQAAARAEERRQSIGARDAWDAYLQERRLKWGGRHYDDHLRKGAPGGNIGHRGKRLQPGILAPLLALSLRELDAPTIEAWAAREGAKRATSARLAWRLLKAFLGWCAEQPAYAGALPAANPAKSKRARESLGKPGAKSDALQREQLPAWFEAVRAIHNPVVAAYCQTVLLTGARPGEVLSLRWSDLNTKWRGLTIADKVEGERVIPLTPFVAQLLAALPRRNEFVFSGVRSPIVAAPNEMHSAACRVAGLEGLTLHGLRRSFKSLTEWLDVPAGVVAQLMGHKPSATAERHYTVRPLDLLRVHHERIEAWILVQAGVTLESSAQAGKLRAVV